MRRVMALGAVLAAGYGCTGERSDEELAPEPVLVEEASRGTFDAPLRVVLDSSQALYQASEYALASRALENVLGRAQDIGDRPAQAEALTWLGYVSWQLADYSEARRIGEEALDLKLQHGLADQLPRSYTQLGLVAWYESRLADAATLFGQAADAGRALDPNHPVIAVAAGNLGLIHTDLGNFDEAREGFLQLRDVGRGLDSARYEGNGLTNLGMLDVTRGDPLSAVTHLNAALDLYRPIDYVSGQQVALGQLAAAYATLGQPRRAFAVLDSALQLSRRTGERDEEGRNLEQLAVLHHEAGNLKYALDLYAEARSVYEEVGLEHERATNLRNVANLHLTLGDFETAIEEASLALTLHRDIGDPFEVLHGLTTLAEVTHRSGQQADAEGHIVSARSLANDLGAPSAQIAVGLQEARLASRNGDHARVLDVLSRIHGPLANGGAAAESEALTLRAMAHAGLGQFEVAVTVGRQAVDAVEQVRSRFGSGELRTSFLAGRVNAYAGLVSALLRLGRVDQAFQVSDAARGRALVENAVAGRPAVGARNGSDYARAEALLREIDQVLVTLTDMQSWPDDERSPATERELDDRLRRSRSEYQAVLVAAQERDQPTAAMLGTRGAELEDVQQALGAREALIEYLVSEERVWLFVVRRDAARAFSTEISEEDLTSRVRVAHGLLGSPGMAQDLANGVLEGLHRALAGPALDAGLLSDVTRLLVVPHTVLNYVPFVALRDGVTGRYLVEDFEVQYLPTAASLPVLRDRRAGPRVGVEQASLFAPMAASLPGTRTETNVIGQTLPESRDWIDQQATEPVVRAALSRGDIVHVATHGVLNVRNPMFSRIELARGAPDGGSSDDGRLEVHELLELEISSPLVFLSGCETGVGAAGWTGFARGEDYATLAQAFLYAGAANVVATLWRIDDDGAADFAERFYRRLAAEHAVTALAEAQREMIENAEYGAPYHWASYRLTGSGSLR